MATYDAVTLDEVKIALGIEGTAEDASLARLISAVTLEVERQLGTQFVQRTITESHWGGEKRLYLNRTPIASVTSMTDARAVVFSSSNYVIRQQRWLEAFGHFDRAYNSAGQETDWTVVYTAGWFASTSAVSPDVKGELIRAISSMREAPNAGVNSIGVGDLSISYASSTTGAVTPSIESAAVALHAYRGVVL